MLIDLLSTSNYVSFNIKVADILGLHAAIYLSELMNINDKAIRKDKIDNSSFIVDRDYISKRTTLTTEEQLNIEANLVKLGIMQKPNDNNNCIILDIMVLTTLMTTEDESLIDDVKVATEKLKNGSKRKQTKTEKVTAELQKNIVTTNAELRQAYFEWIDAVITKDGWLTKAAVVAAQQIIDNLPNRDLDVALRILQIASINGHRDLQWSLEKYYKEYKVTYRTTQPTPRDAFIPKPVQVSSEVF